jgi:hypothetical protein
MSDCSSPVRRGEADTLLLDRRQWLRAALAATLLPAVSLPARAGFNFFENEFTATRDELQAELARRFPITRRYGELFLVSLHDPQLALDGSANRATLASRLVISSPVLQPSSVGGQVAISSGLRWDAGGLAVRLQDPRAEQLRIDGITGNDAQNLQRIGAAVAQEALKGYPLHTFRPEELRFGLKTYEVQSINIGDDAIKVRFQ